MFDAGDGPVVFGILIVGAIVCGLALWVEFTFSAAALGPCRAVAAADLPSDRRLPAPVQVGAAGAAIQAQGGRGRLANDARRFRPYPGLTIACAVLFAIAVRAGRLAAANGCNGSWR